MIHLQRGQWCLALMFMLLYSRIGCCRNCRVAVIWDVMLLMRHHCDVFVLSRYVQHVVYSNVNAHGMVRRPSDGNRPLPPAPGDDSGDHRALNGGYETPLNQHVPYMNTIHIRTTWYYHGLTLIPTWIRNYPSKSVRWNYSLIPQCACVEVWERKSNFTPHFTLHWTCDYLPMLTFNLIDVN